MTGWVKAGLIGGAAAVGLSLVGLIPCVGCVTWILLLATYGCVGALAVYWTPAVPMTGSAAGHGALAGLIAGAISGVASVFLSTVQAAIVGPPQVAAFKQLPPEVWGQLHTAGVDPGVFARIFGSVAGAPFFSTLCCGIGLAIAAGLGALGGLIFAAVKSE